MAKNTPDLPRDIAEMSFEQALSGLEQIVSKLESGKVELEESIDIYTRGTHLREHCATKLADAQMKIDKIVQKSDGSVTAEPADMD